MHKLEEGARLQGSTEAAAAGLVSGVRLRIFLLSFTLLFFELLCIRWIPAYVRYLSYFTNFILLVRKSFVSLCQSIECIS